ncbi:uncharacterized protein AAG666_021955 isoform 3-T3 [Megaptera novaeangliae]
MGCWILDQEMKLLGWCRMNGKVECLNREASRGLSIPALLMIPTSSVDTQGRRAEWISELEAASSTSVEIVAIVFIQLPAQSSEQSICSVEHIWNEYEKLLEMYP